MYRRTDWVTVPPNLGHPKSFREKGRPVGIITEVDLTMAKVALVNDQGNTLHRLNEEKNCIEDNIVDVQVVDLQFIKSRNSVPGPRLATYKPNWNPRGVRRGWIMEDPTITGDGK